MFRTVHAVATLLIAAVPLSALGDGAPTDDIVDDVMSHLGFGKQHEEKLRSGEILFSGQPDLETLPEGIAVAGAMMLLEMPPEELVDAYLSDEILRSHSDVLAVGSVPQQGGTVDDIANLGFEADEQPEARRLLEARPGDDLNLSLTEIDQLRAIVPGDSATADAIAAYREALWHRLEAYRSSGLGGITPYARKSGKPSNPGAEMRAALESTTLLEKYFPVMQRALVDYPDSMSEIGESRLLWIKKSVAKRPAVALAHRLLLVSDGFTIVAEREFYVGHTYNSMLTIAAVVAHEKGSLVFATNRVFTEKVLGARLKKSIGRKKVAREFARHFEELRGLVSAREQAPH